MQSDSEHMARRDPAEAKNDLRAAGGLALFPATVIALGGDTAPTERLLAAQAAVARAVGLLTALRFARRRVPLRSPADRALASR
jgi:hypothetical protein